MEDHFIFVLGILFVCCVIPYWLKLHYGDKKKKQTQSPPSNPAKLQSLAGLADDLQKRVSVLEKILDNESPEWRKKYE